MDSELFDVLPVPLPDEHAASIVYRWFQQCPYSNIESYFKEQLDLPFFDMPRKSWMDIYRYLLSAIKSAISFPDFLTKFTNVSDYVIFPGEHLSCQDSAEILRKLSTQKFLNSVHISTDKMWRFCPVCAKEDEEKYGTSYWHVSHQRYYQRTCQKHRVLLQSNNHHHFILPPAALAPTEACEQSISMDFKLRKLVSLIRQIPAHERKARIIQGLWQKLGTIYSLRNREEAHCRIRINHQELAAKTNQSAIAAFFEWDRLRPGCYPLEAQRGLSWMLDPHRILHPMFYFWLTHTFLDEQEIDQIVEAKFDPVKGRHALQPIIQTFLKNACAA